MEMETIISLGFLIIGGGFVGTLLMAIIKMLGIPKPPNKSLAQHLFGIFKLAIIFTILLVLFIAFVVVPNS